MCTKKILLSRLPSVCSKILRPFAFPTNAIRHLDESPLATSQVQVGKVGAERNGGACSPPRVFPGRDP
uniref:Uncharacterized protein n=1 Tax=Oryza punctata TaxID=4537 RepID=A0A0E0JMK6_ORYPU